MYKKAEQCTGVYSTCTPHEMAGHGRPSDSNYKQSPITRQPGRGRCMFSIVGKRAECGRRVSNTNDNGTVHKGSDLS